MPPGQEELFARLGKSAFRSKFKLSSADRAYIDSRGMETIARHAEDFVAARLSPAQPNNDGRQTPLRGHPVFVAQHATATCCRGCVAKWHGIAQARALSAAQQRYLVEVILVWIARQLHEGRA
jgi:exodeoxyribonuclease V alpha subunit